MAALRRLVPAVLGAASLLLIVAAPALADLEGRYSVEGRNPGGEGSYSGQAAVQQQGSVYRVAWKVGRQQYVGTGIRREDTFSVVYQGAGDGGRPGLVVYQIRDDGSLVGLWVPLGGDKTGLERWTPAGRDG